MAKDRHPGSESGDSFDWLGSDPPADATPAPRPESDLEFRSDFGEPPPSQSEVDYLELGEPSRPNGPSGSGVLDIGEPSRSASATNDDAVVLEPEEEGSFIDIGPLVDPDRPPPVVPGPRPPDRPKAVAPTRGGGFKLGLIPTLAAVLVAGAVPSYLIYRDRQGQVDREIAASRKAAADSAQAKTEVEKARRELATVGGEAAKAREDAARAKADQEAAIALAVAGQKAESEKAIADAIAKEQADTKAAIAKEQAAKEAAIALAVAGQKAESEKAIALAVAKARGESRPGNGNPPFNPPLPRPDPHEVSPEKSRQAIQLIRSPDEAKTTQGIRQIVGLAIDADNPEVFGATIKDLDALLADPDAARRLIDACAAARQSDPKHAAGYNAFRVRLDNAIRAKSNPASGSNDNRAPGPRGDSAPARLISTRAVRSTSAPARPLVQGPIPGKSPREVELEGMIRDAEVDLEADKDGSSNMILDRDLAMIRASLELAGLLERRGQFDDAIGRYDQAITAYEDAQKRLKDSTSAGPPDPRETNVIQQLAAAIPVVKHLRNGYEDATKKRLRALAERDSALAERDALKTERASLTTERDALKTERDFAQAEIRRLRSIDTTPDRKVREDAFLAYASGIDRFGARDYANADRSFSQAIGWYPRDPRFHYLRGIVRHQLARQGARFEGAETPEDDIRRGVRLEATDRGSFGEVGHILARMSDDTLPWVESIRHPAPPPTPPSSGTVAPAWNPPANAVECCQPAP